MTTKKALEVEATNSDHTFEYLEESYTVPPAKRWPLDAVEAQEDGNMIGFLKALLGLDQYRTLRKKVDNIEQLDDFIGVMFDALDVDRGK